MLGTLKLLALLGIFMLVGLIGWTGVKDVVARKARRGLCKIISGIGLLTWGLLGASMFPREQFATIADWGIFIVGGVAAKQKANASRQVPRSDCARDYELC